MRKKNSEIGLATVYRTLEILTDLKIVDKVSFNDGVARYDLRKEGAKHFHHHLLCLECGNIEEVQKIKTNDTIRGTLLCGKNLAKKSLKSPSMRASTAPIVTAPLPKAAVHFAVCPVLAI